MRRLIGSALLIGLLPLPVAGVAGCGGSEGGSQQISEKFAPDPELDAANVKAGKGKGKSGGVRSGSRD